MENVSNVSGTFQLRKVRIPDVYFGEEAVVAQVTFVVDDRKDRGMILTVFLGFEDLNFGR
jgi:hypothetical protein